MADLPGYVVRALAQHTSDEPRGFLETAARHPFGRLGDEQPLATLWIVVTDAQVWLIAAHDEDSWAVADGSHDALRLDKGWLRDDIVCVGRTLALPSRSRAAAESLLATWQAAPRGGATVPPPKPASVPAGRAPVARAVKAPPGWAAKVPAQPGARWLLVHETAATHAFPAPDGQPLHGRIYVGVADQHITLWAESDDGQIATRTVGGPLKRTRQRGRSMLVASGTELSGTLLGSSTEDLISALSERDADGRWAHLAAHHAARGDNRIAFDLWIEAIECEHDALCWPDIARSAWVACDVKRARAALAHGIRLRTVRAGERTEWTAPVSDWQATTRQPQAAAAQLNDGLGPAIDLLDVPEVPSVFPWPPADEVELWTTALASLGRWTDAAAAARALPEGPRGLEVRASVAAAEGRRNAASLWSDAAIAWRAQRQTTAALRCLDHVLRDAPTPTDHWRAGAWRWQDGHPTQAAAAWTQALAVDPEGAELILPCDADGWRLLAQTAAAVDATAVQVRAWEAVRETEPDDLPAALAYIELLTGPANRPEDAATALEDVAERIEAGSMGADADLRASTFWLQAAALRQGDAAVANGKRAVVADFLHPDAWRGAQHAEHMPQPLSDWWGHGARVLAGASAPKVPSPGRKTYLNTEAREALHPGGTGWWHAVRAPLDAAALPDRAQLTRGLEPLTTAWPEAAAMVDDLCAAMRIDPPGGFVYRGQGAWGVSAWPIVDPVLLVGVDHLREGPRHLSPEALRYALAVELAHLACEHPVLQVDASFGGTSRSVYAALGRFAGTAENVVDVLTLLPGIDTLTKIEKLVRVSRKVFAARHALDKVADVATPLLSRLGPDAPLPRGLGTEGLQGAHLHMRLHADRVALVITGDLAAAVDAILRTSTASSAYADSVQHDGLAAVLAHADATLAPDEILRLTSLVAFAAQEGPFGTVAPR